MPTWRGPRPAPASSVSSSPPQPYRDDLAIAFLNRYPTLSGYVLVAPIEHKEDVVTDFDEEA
jgi:diadenosine tetraphosphate (Ap4A) HIT family hydrolase